MSEKHIFEAAFTDEVPDEKTAIAAVLKKAKADGMNVKILAKKLVEDGEGNRSLQVLAESRESDFDKEFPVDVEDIVDTPPSGPIDSLDEEDEPESLDDKVDDLVDKVDTLIDKVEDSLGEGDDDEDEDTFGDPDTDSVVDFDDDKDDDPFFESKTKRARLKKRTPRGRNRRQVSKRVAAPVKRLTASAIDDSGRLISASYARKDAEALVKKDRDLKGYKLARFGVDKKAKTYVAEYKRS